MTRLPLLLFALLLAPAALAQQSTATYETTLQDKLEELHRSLDALRADSARLDSLRRTLDDLRPTPEQLQTLRRALDAQLADPQHIDDMRRTLDRLKSTLDAELPPVSAPDARSLDSQTPASRATPSSPRP